MTFCVTFTYRNSHQSEDAGGHAEDCNEIAYFTVHFTKGPVAVKHIDKIFKHVKKCDHCVRKTEIHQKIIGYSSLLKAKRFVIFLITYLNHDRVSL